MCFYRAVILTVTRWTWTPLLLRWAYPFHPLHGTLLICDITGFTTWLALSHHFQLHCDHGGRSFFRFPSLTAGCVRLGDQVHLHNFTENKFTVFNRKLYRHGDVRDFHTARYLSREARTFDEWNYIKQKNKWPTNKWYSEEEHYKH